MRKVVRLTESDIYRIVKKVIKEQDEFEPEERSGKSCPTSVGRFINKITKSLTDDEIEAIVNVFEREGEDGFERKVMSVMDDTKLRETRGDNKFRSAIHKISKIVALSGTGVLATVGLFLPCLEGIDMQNPPSWFQDAINVSIVAGIPVTFAALIILRLTEED